jgi:hypothetical protein
MTKLRVMYIVRNFPQITQTYIKSEIEAVCNEFEVNIVALTKPNISYKHHAPFVLSGDPHEIRQMISDFKPHVIHAHYLDQVKHILNIYAHSCSECGSLSNNIPFTIRAHSFDVLQVNQDHLRDIAQSLNNELCIGVLTFPFTRALLESAGVLPDKINECYPVIGYRKFYDESPNGSSVMNIGACLPKKKMSDFIELAAALPDSEFNLYAVGHQVGQIGQLNKEMGSPVNFITPVEPDDMPREYKKHRWLVYTAARKPATVGWPMSVAEAQASGVGVCMPNIRSDLREYVGDAGYLYDSIGEAADIISKPFPEELRQLGFQQAMKSDVFQHKTILTDLWRKAAGVRAS